MPFPFSDNFDSYSNGDTLTVAGSAKWTGDSDIQVQNTFPGISSPNSIYNTNTGSKGAFGLTQDNNSGDVIISCSFKWFSFTAKQEVDSILLRWSDQVTSLSGSGYRVARFQGGGSAGGQEVVLYRYNSGTPTNLVDVSGLTLENNVWYNMLVAPVGSLIKVQVKDIDGSNAGKYLDSGGAWQSSSTTYVISHTDSSPINSAGYGGILLDGLGSATQGVADDFSFISAAPPVFTEMNLERSIRGLNRGYCRGAF
jgi:hypothetical protein